MNSPNRTLIVEVRTIENSHFDPAQTLPLIIYQDTNDNYFISTGIEPIKAAIIQAIPHLGSNYRHSLLFDVQVISGDEVDAFIASVER